MPVADEQKLHVALERIAKRVEASPSAQGLRQMGSMYFFSRAAELGTLTERNGQYGQSSEALRRLGLAFVQQGLAAKRHVVDLILPSIPSPEKLSAQPLPLPEFETVAGFTVRCGITDLDAVFTLSDLCLKLGLDPVATSAAVAFMMECQQARLSPTDTLPWGDGEAVLAAIERLAQSSEKRDVLSLGVGEMKEIFFGSTDFAPQVKGLAMTTLDPRAVMEVALAMATAPIGGDYRYAMTYEELLTDPPAWLPDTPASAQSSEGKVTRLIWHERFAAVLDAAGLCRRLGLMAYRVAPGELLALISAVTGRPISGADIARIGERLVTVERLFAQQQCYDGARDELPRRWRDTPLETGPAAGYVPDLPRLLTEYYRRHGWDRQGTPTRQRRDELGLE